MPISQTFQDSQLWNMFTVTYARIVNGIVSEKAKMYSFRIISQIVDGIITGIIMHV